ncbi:MAG: hypothetical protein M5R36_09855 [Deltaproteobacteria bacterium]|nr:hypothetical protein [Deltaproteobacteria bacterium]
MNGDLQKTYDALVADTKEISDLGNIAGLLSWDQETFMPPKGLQAKARQLALMSGIVHRRQTDARRGEWIARLADAESDLDSPARATLRETKRSYDRLTKLPAELVEEETRTCSLAHDEWIKARKQKRFRALSPVA